VFTDCLRSLYIGTGAATALITVGAAVGPSRHVDLGVLYILVVIYTALFFSPLVTLGFGCAAGGCYALVLGGLGPTVANPVAAWLSVFGTATAAGVVVTGLVGVLRSDAREDSLTGLANRRSWDERLEEEIERSRRTGAALSIAMIDLDGFKAVNDRYGHQAGDHLLRELASSWQASVRSSEDTLARLGGDEFAMLAPGSDATGIRRLVKRLREIAPESVGFSVGVATWNTEESAGEFLRRADLSMYQAKLRRRDTPRG